MARVRRWSDITFAVSTTERFLHFIHHTRDVGNPIEEPGLAFEVGRIRNAGPQIRPPWKISYKLWSCCYDLIARTLANSSLPAAELCRAREARRTQLCLLLSYLLYNDALNVRYEIWRRNDSRGGRTGRPAFEIAARWLEAWFIASKGMPMRFPESCHWPIAARLRREHAIVDVRLMSSLPPLFLKPEPNIATLNSSSLSIVVRSQSLYMVEIRAIGRSRDVTGAPTGMTLWCYISSAPLARRFIFHAQGRCGGRSLRIWPSIPEDLSRTNDKSIPLTEVSPCSDFRYSTCTEMDLPRKHFK